MNEMIDINSFVDEYVNALEKNFKDRIWFVGLQGSYGRTGAAGIF
ncbi:hypothetical protein [Eisenbergiella porci]|nr:hypothetical protein [Eisenbergiella porci]